MIGLLDPPIAEPRGNLSEYTATIILYLYFCPYISTSFVRHIIRAYFSDELWLKFENENQYCKWLAALKLGCKGITMASNNYKARYDIKQLGFIIKNFCVICR